MTHGPIGDLHQEQPVLAAQLDAALVVPVRADQPTAQVLGVAEPAQSRRLGLNRSRLPGQREAASMLAQASLDVAAREQHVPAQEGDARAFMVLSAGGRLGAF